MDSSFVKLPQCGPKTCFLLTHMKEEGREGFDLTLTDGEKFWEGQVTEEDLDALCSNLKMDFNTYVAETAKAFTRRSMGDLNFVYQLKAQTGDVVDFIWKKDVGDIKILMGSATLHQQKGSTKALTSLFTSCISMVGELQQKIHTLEAENQRLAQERQNALKRLDKCVSAKEELEQDLYSKFVAVLNSKKEKIRNLQEGGGETAETLEDDPVPSTSDEAVNGKRGRKNPSIRDLSPPTETFGDAGESDGGQDRDTDDETPAKRRRAPRSKAAKVDADSSLNLGDDDDDSGSKAKVVKRPARQRGGNKRQTPAKPVLPKVSSRSSDSGPTRTPHRNSLRKSGSGSSGRSVDNLDTDDLLNDF